MKTKYKTKYILDRINLLVSMINTMSQRQRDISREIRKSSDSQHKDTLCQERQFNSEALRVMHWLLMILREVPLIVRVKRDPGYIGWIEKVHACEVRSTLGEVLGLSEYEMKNCCSLGIHERLQHYDYKKFDQYNLYKKIVDRIFPPEDGSLFVWDSIEKDLWRERLETTIENELRFFSLIVNDWVKTASENELRFFQANRE